MAAELAPALQAAAAGGLAKNRNASTAEPTVAAMVKLRMDKLLFENA